MPKTLKPLPAIVLPDGTVQLEETIRLTAPARAIVTLIIEEGQPLLPLTARPTPVVAKPTGFVQRWSGTVRRQNASDDAWLERINAKHLR